MGAVPGRVSFPMQAFRHSILVGLHLCAECPTTLSPGPVGTCRPILTSAPIKPKGYYKSGPVTYVNRDIS